MISTQNSVFFLCSISVAALALSPLRAVPASAADIDLGPLFSRDTTPDGETRLRMLGPLFEERVSTNGRIVKALRPLFTRSIEADGKDNSTDLLWPLASAETMGNEVSSRFASMFFTDFDKTNRMSRWRLWVLPLLLMGRDCAGENYFGVFPLAGKANEILIFDKAEIFLFPLYMRTLHNRQETTDILWPMISATKGKGVRRWRLFPIYGWTRSKGKYESMFLLWPVFSWSSYMQPDEKGGGFVFFPFIGRIYKQDLKSWLFFPPLFRWTEGERYREAHLPWPFVQISRGRSNRFYLWPLGGGKSEPGMRDGFVMWPIISSGQRETKGEIAGRLSVVPFLQYETHKKVVEGKNPGVTETTGQSLKLWPLFTSRTIGTTNTFRTLALWPALDVGPLENTYAPVWTLFSRTVTTGSSDSEFLWGLIRRRKDPAGAASSIFPLVSWRRSTDKEGAQDWSFLLGLVGYRKEGNRGSLRLLFMDFGGGKAKSERSGN